MSRLYSHPRKYRKIFLGNSFYVLVSCQGVQVKEKPYILDVAHHEGNLEAWTGPQCLGVDRKRGGHSLVFPPLSTLCKSLEGTKLPRQRGSPLGRSVFFREDLGNFWEGLGNFWGSLWNFWKTLWTALKIHSQRSFWEVESAPTSGAT